MPARALATHANVVVERGGMTFTGAVVPDRDGVRIIFTVRNVKTGLTVGPYGFIAVNARATVTDTRGRVVPNRPRWSTGAVLRFEETPTLHWTLILEPPEPDARSLLLSFDGPAGEWNVQLPLKDEIEQTGIPARSLAATDHKLGITLACRAVARSDAMTAIELEAYLDPPSDAEGWARRYVLGIGASMGGGRLCGDQVVLRDDAGAVHFERGRSVLEPTGGKQREAVLFPAIAHTVRNVTIEVDLVWLHEGTEASLNIPVPGATDITIAGCTSRVAVTRITPRAGQFPHLTDGPARSAIHIETTPLDADADRQLVYVPPAENTRVGMTVSHCVGQLPTVEIPETGEELSAITVRGGTVQVRGHWRLQVPLEP
jgi:hypothetical protein